MPTAQIDLITYTNNNTDSSGSAKSYADNSSDFENVLNEINKAYSEQDSQKNEPANTQTQTEPQKINDKVTESPTEKSEKVSQKNKDDKQAEETTDKNDAVKISKENSKENSSADKVKEKDGKDEKAGKTQKVDDNIENKIIDKNSQEEEKKAEDLKEVKSEEITQKAEAKPDNIEEPAQKDIKASTTDIESPKNTVDANTANLPVENIIEKLPANSNKEASDLTNKDLTINGQNEDKINPVQNKQAQVKQSQPVQEDFRVTNSTENLDELLKNQQVQVQTQTEQVLTNLKINSQDVSPKAPQLQTETPQVQPQTETAPEQKTNTETPVINANADIIVNDANINSSLTDINAKKNVQDNSSKAPLSQEILTKTNAQVVNVETSNSSNSNTNSHQDNVLSKQNAHEQAVKLELENNSNNISQNNTQDIDLTDTIDSTAQTAADKMIENTQAPAQASPQPANNLQTVTMQATQAPQTSRELSQSDILSQINNQLDMKKLQEEGTTKVNIVLKPENLGKINLEFVNSKEGLTAKMTTDNAQVKELLSKSLDSLKDSLSNQGVNVNSVTVKVEETQKQSNNMFSFDDGQPQEGNQEFSNNAQKQNQREFSFDEKGERIITEGEERINAEQDVEIEEVSVSPYSTNIDYKV